MVNQDLRRCLYPLKGLGKTYMSKEKEYPWSPQVHNSISAQEAEYFVFYTLSFILGLLITSNEEPNVGTQALSRYLYLLKDLREVPLE